jgi:hypothetical protein
MRHLLAPPRVVLHPPIAARLLRGGSASVIAHALLVLVLALAARGITANPPLPRTPRVVLLAALPGNPGTPPRREAEAPFRERPDEHAPDTLPLTVRNYVSGDELTIDLARIRQRRNDLFPFVTWDLRALGERPTSAAKGIEWPSPFLPGSSASTQPLSLSPDALQSLIDRAWSRRERWVNLHELVTLTGRYDPDTGDLARVFNGYVTQNVPQPYEDWAFPDPVFWITVTLAADDAPLLQFALEYLKQHPASRVTTELLFLLDDSAVTSCDVLGQVLMVGTDELPLDVTKRSNPDAYELAASLSSAYKSWIRKYSVNAAERCVVARTAILRRIIDTSPDHYGAADARFRLGEMMWSVGRREDAVRWWRGMTPDQRNAYDQARRELLGAISDGAIRNNPQRIDSILANEERRWRYRAADRLASFGSAANKF